MSGKDIDVFMLNDDAAERVALKVEQDILASDKDFYMLVKMILMAYDALDKTHPADRQAVLDRHWPDYERRLRQPFSNHTSVISKVLQRIPA